MHRKCRPKLEVFIVAEVCRKLFLLTMRPCDLDRDGHHLMIIYHLHHRHHKHLPSDLRMTGAY